MIVFYGDPVPGSSARRVAHVVTDCSADYRAWLADQPGWVETPLVAMPDALMVIEVDGELTAALRPEATVVLSAVTVAVGGAVTLSGLTAGAAIGIGGPVQADGEATGASEDLTFAAPGSYVVTVEDWPKAVASFALEVTP